MSGPPADARPTRSRSGIFRPQLTAAGQAPAGRALADAIVRGDEGIPRGLRREDLELLLS